MLDVSPRVRRRRRYKYQEDAANAMQISEHITTKLGRKIKLLPTGWHKYTEKANSFCQVIMKGLAIPDGIEKKGYWEESVLYLVNEKINAWKGNSQTKVKEHFMSKFYTDKCFHVLLL